MGNLIEFFKKLWNATKNYFDKTHQLDQAKISAQYLLSFIAEREAHMWGIEERMELHTFDALFNAVKPVEVNEGSAIDVEHFQGIGSKYIFEALQEKKLLSLK